MKGLVILLTFKAYLDNSYLKEIQGNILEKSFKNNKYYLKLDRTIFYPHLAGGQPKDKGKINGVNVIDVYEDGDNIIHVVKENITNNKVYMSIDWDNRFDLMQQHTGQHLLSYAFNSLFSAETIGFHMGEDYTTIDIKKSDLTEEEVEKIEFLTNKIIQSNFVISTYMVDETQLSKLPVERLPSVDEDIRIVEIDGLDYSPCCGTHVNYTGEVGLVKIRKWERYKGNIRVDFVCGFRALKDYSWKNQYIREMSLMLSSKDKDLLEKTKLLMEQKYTLEKENRNLLEELYKYKGELYLKEAKSYDSINYIVKEFHDNSLKELSFIASYLNNKEKLIQIYSVSNETSGQFLVSRSKDLDIDLRELLNEISESLILKGGGSPQMIQGGSSLVLLDNVIRSFYKEIRKYYKG